VHEIVFNRFPDADINASIVWIPILDNDSLEAAIPSIKFLSDKRIQHYYDQNQIVGKKIAHSVGWAGNIAWDIYLFYQPYAEWSDMPPSPSCWMHQLTDDWATKVKYRTGLDLNNELLLSMEKLQVSSLRSQLE
jgi:hypothetical protein